MNTTTRAGSIWYLITRPAIEQEKDKASETQLHYVSNGISQVLTFSLNLFVFIPEPPSARPCSNPILTEIFVISFLVGKQKNDTKSKGHRGIKIDEKFSDQHDGPRR